MSATVTELRPVDQAAAERKAKREATEAKVREQAAKDSAEIAKRNGAERLTSQARHVLRREGLPCMFVPADRAESVAEAIGAAVAAWDLDAAVAALRPYASEPMGMVVAVGDVAQRRLGELLSTTAYASDRTVKGKYGNDRSISYAQHCADMKRLVAETGREIKRTRKGEGKRAAPRRAAAKAKPAPIAPQPEPIEEETMPCSEERYALLGGPARVEPETVETAPVVHAPAAPTPAATIPQPLADYLARLVNGAKLTYAAALVAHLYTGADAPEMPAADWAPKALAKVEKYAGRKVKR
jgi:hypothetical protein